MPSNGPQFEKKQTIDPSTKKRSPTRMAALALEGASLRASATATRTPQNGSAAMCLLGCVVWCSWFTSEGSGVSGSEGKIRWSCGLYTSWPRTAHGPDEAHGGGRAGLVDQLRVRPDPRGLFG